MGKLLESASPEARGEHAGEINKTLRNLQAVVSEFPKVLHTLNEMKTQAANRDIAIATLQQGHQKTQADLERHFQEGKESSRKLDAIAELLTSAMSKPSALLPSAMSLNHPLNTNRPPNVERGKKH